MDSIKGFAYSTPAINSAPMAGASNAAQTQNATPQEKLSITQKQLSDVEAQVSKDMEALNQAQHKYNTAHTWGDRFGTISAKAAKLSLPTFIASVVTSLAASFLAIPALGALAGVASVACMATGATWLGTLGAEKLCEHAEKKAEKNLPELTMKVQSENKEVINLENQIKYLNKQIGSGATAPPPPQNKPADAPKVSTPISAPAEKTADKPAVAAPAEDDEEKKPVQNLDVTDNNDGFVDIGGITIKKND
jgi:hypothetical protein